MGATLAREMPEAHAPSLPLLRRLIIDLAIMMAIGVVLGLLGPFGSYNDPIEQRLLYWVGLSLAGYCCYAPVGALVVPCGKRLDLPEWGMWIASVLIATVPMTMIVWALGFIGRDFRWPRLDQAFYSYLNMLLIGAGITVLFNILDRRAAVHVLVDEKQTEAQPSTPTYEAPATSSGPRFLDRLPAEIGADLIALEMEDHYVRAHTALGSELVLLRMVELDGIEGEQVHRSWWVARGAFADVKREGRNMRLVLDNGIEAPVSRANVALLKERVWT